MANIRITSELGESGGLVADGIETDWLQFLDGQTVHVTLAPGGLRLVVPASQRAAREPGGEGQR